MLFTIFSKFIRLKLWTIVLLDGIRQLMYAEAISQAVYDLFSGSGLHDLNFVKPAVVVNNY